MTFKEYADSRSISYEAVRQLVKKTPGINAYIEKNGRTRVLTSEAVNMLDNRRNRSRVSIINKQDTSQELIDNLKNEIILLQKQLLEAKEQALESSQALARLQAIEDNNDKLERKIEALQSELGAYHKTIFGLYRKLKP